MRYEETANKRYRKNAQKTGILGVETGNMGVRPGGLG